MGAYHAVRGELFRESNLLVVYRHDLYVEITAQTWRNGVGRDLGDVRTHIWSGLVDPDRRAEKFPNSSAAISLVLDVTMIQLLRMFGL